MAMGQRGFCALGEWCALQGLNLRRAPCFTGLRWVWRGFG